jgi:hypothetical protein
MAPFTNLDQSIISNNRHHKFSSSVEKIANGVEIIDLPDDDDDNDDQPASATSIFPAGNKLSRSVNHLRASNASALLLKKAAAKKRKGRIFVRSSTQPLTEFHFFTKLPSELRDKIWAYAILHPHKLRISINWTSNWEPGDPENPLEHPIIFKPIPSMSILDHRSTLRACKESRAESKRLLTNTLEVRGMRGKRVLYFNATLDTISTDSASQFALLICNGQFSCDAFVRNTVLDTLKFDCGRFSGFDTIQRLIVNEIGFYNGNRLYGGLGVLIPRLFHGLKSLEFSQPKLNAARYHVGRSIQKNFSSVCCPKLWLDGSSIIITSLWIGALVEKLYDGDVFDFSTIPGLRVVTFW